MLLRAYELADCPALLRLFYDTVHAVCAADYTAEQLDAWATGREDAAAWNRSLRAHRTLVAVLAGEIAGFADLDTAAVLPERECMLQRIILDLRSCVPSEMKF